MLWRKILQAFNNFATRIIWLFLLSSAGRQQQRLPSSQMNPLFNVAPPLPLPFCLYNVHIHVLLIRLLAFQSANFLLLSSAFFDEFLSSHRHTHMHTRVFLRLPLPGSHHNSRRRTDNSSLESGPRCKNKYYNSEEGCLVRLLLY